MDTYSRSGYAGFRPPRTNCPSAALLVALYGLQVLAIVVLSLRGASWASAVGGAVGLLVVDVVATTGRVDLRRLAARWATGLLSKAQPGLG